MNKRDEYLQALKAVEQAACGSHLHRLAFAPARYLFGMFYSKLIYPYTRRSLQQEAPVFWGEEMEVQLPAGLDIYLLGAKSHESEIRLARFMIKTLEEGMAMLDVGAHFGFFSRLGAALVGGTGKVLAVEAADSTFKALERNIHSQPHIEAIRAAASDAEGTLAFYEFPPLYSEYNTLEKDQFKDASWLGRIPPIVSKVPACRMDKLMEGEGLSAHFIKIDVEGAEAQVVAGLEGWFKRSNSRWLAMEFLAAQRHNESHRRAASLLAEHGWMPYAIQPDGSLGACPDVEGYLEKKGLDSDNIVFQPDALHIANLRPR